jgi:amidohydrolase
MIAPMTALPDDPPTAIRELTDEVSPRLIDIRRDLHAHPELAFGEVRTAAVVVRELDRLGIPHQSGIGITGVVGFIEGGRPDPVLAIRTEMDALPIQECTGLEFSSTVPGRMHACGHDLHTATLLGVATLLQALAPRLAGSVKLIFQPAEEAMSGMQAMIDDGVLESPRIDMALGFHNQPVLPVGRFGFCRGACLAAADTFDVVVHGRSGHAAHPYAAIDPVVAAAQLVTQLQTVVSREVRPFHHVVVTVGSIHGGEAANIIPDSVRITGIVRTLQSESREVAEQAIRRLCAGLLHSMRVHCDVTYERGVPPLVNDAHVTDVVVGAVRAQLGDVVDEGDPSMGGEDFALLAERVPGFQLRIGSGAPGRHDRLHNSGYRPDEASIALGVQALVRATLDLLA